MRTLLFALATSLLVPGDAGAEDTCLAGASRLRDQRDLAALRSAIDAACPSASFTGAPRAERSNYRRCARQVRDAALVSGHLRQQCSKVATHGYWTPRAARRARSHAVG